MVEGSAGIRSSQMMPPIRVVDTSSPCDSPVLSPGVYRFRYGAEHEWLGPLQMRGAQGQKSLLRYAELNTTRV